MMEKEHQIKTHSHLLLCHNSISFTPFLPKLHCIQFTEYSFKKPPHFFQKESVTTRHSSSKSVTHLTGSQKEEPGWWE